MKQQKFKILKTGNFYFPFINKDEKFIVENTIDITIDNKKDIELIELCFKLKDHFHFGTLAEPIWNVLKDTFKKELDKEYKNCWFVPCILYKFDKKYICSVDILRKVK